MNRNAMPDCGLGNRALVAVLSILRSPGQAEPATVAPADRPPPRGKPAPWAAGRRAREVRHG